MARILLLIIIVFLIYLVFRGFFRAQTRKDEPPADRALKAEDMIQCARCGVNLPRSEAQAEAGSLVCRDNPHCRT